MTYLDSFCILHKTLSSLLSTDLFTYLSSPVDFQFLEVKNHVVIIIISS